MTLGELADTTSGLPDLLPDPALIVTLPPERQLTAASRLLAGYTDADFLKDLRDVRLVAKPGTVARHSNVAAQLLGFVVGRMFGLPFAAALADRIERPLGMASSGRTADRQPATGYAAAAGRAAPTFSGESIEPAGGLRYSARDMARFLEFQLSGADAAVRLSQAVRFVDAPDRQLAFTWIRSGKPGAYRFRTSGGTFGASAFVEFRPALRYGAALMANRAAGTTQDELEALAAEVFAKVSPTLAPCPAASASSSD